MIPESFQIPALAAAIIALASFIIIPAIAMNDRMDVQESSSDAMAQTDGASCVLPPALDIKEGRFNFSPGPLPIDDHEVRLLETATFALG